MAAGVGVALDGGVVAVGVGSCLASAPAHLRRLMDEHSEQVTCLAFKPYTPISRRLAPAERLILASSSADSSIIVWDVGLGKAIDQFVDYHRASITALAWNPTGTRIASSSVDKSLRLTADLKY